MLRQICLSPQLNTNVVTNADPHLILCRAAVSNNIL